MLLRVLPEHFHKFGSVDAPTFMHCNSSHQSITKHVLNLLYYAAVTTHDKKCTNKLKRSSQTCSLRPSILIQQKATPTSYCNQQWDGPVSLWCRILCSISSRLQWFLLALVRRSCNTSHNPAHTSLDRSRRPEGEGPTGHTHWGWKRPRRPWRASVVGREGERGEEGGRGEGEREGEWDYHCLDRSYQTWATWQPGESILPPQQLYCETTPSPYSNKTIKNITHTQSIH